MKHLRLAISLSALSVCALRAQDEKQGPPPVEIPDFSNLDEYIYVPKSMLHFGSRFISGPKSSFSGKGRISTGEDISVTTGTATGRSYHDGGVGLDSRTTTVDNGDGTSTSVPVPNDGKTNTWFYSDSRQLTSDGLMTFHTYSAQVLDSAARTKDISGTVGMELFVAYDMGKLGKYLEWSLLAGFSMNDLSAKVRDHVRADLTSINDTYNLFGEIAPTAPYSAPSSGSTSVTNSDGTVNSTTVDTTTLIGNVPLSRTSTTTTDSTSVSNLWRVKGAYYTLRAGPSISLPFATRFHASLSAGPSIVYAGTTYSVTQTYQPEIGSAVTKELSDGTSRVLAGYYADATVQFDLTERTGFYLGAVYQANGSYEQTVSNGDAKYTTKIDLNSLNGFRGGLTFRF
jgi:hypothetical protein